ncbi:hypothetical protein GGI35DRAFT_407522 [Trichoderma velutinum]
MASPSVFCNDEYAVGCVDGDSQARNGGAYIGQFHIRPTASALCLIRGGCQFEVLHHRPHFNSSYIYDCRAMTMSVAEAGPLAAMIYHRRLWRGLPVARVQNSQAHASCLAKSSSSDRHVETAWLKRRVHTCTYMLVRRKWQPFAKGRHIHALASAMVDTSNLILRSKATWMPGDMVHIRRSRCDKAR